MVWETVAELLTDVFLITSVAVISYLSTVKSDVDGNNDHAQAILLDDEKVLVPIVFALTFDTLKFDFHTATLGISVCTVSE